MSLSLPFMFLSYHENIINDALLLTLIVLFYIYEQNTNIYM